MPMAARKPAQRITHTLVRLPPPSKARTDTALGEVLRPSLRMVRAPTRSTTPQHREQQDRYRLLPAERPLVRAARTAIVQARAKRQTATCMRARTAMSTRTPAAVGKSRQQWQLEFRELLWRRAAFLLQTQGRLTNSTSQEHPFQLLVTLFIALPTIHRAARRKACNRKRRTETEASNRASDTLSSVRVADGGIAAAVAVAGEEVVVEGEDSQTL